MSTPHTTPPAQALTGTAENGSTVTVYDNSTQVGTTTADAASGAWSLPIGQLSDGSTHGYTVTATDAVGNVSQPSTALSFVVDTTAPTVAMSIDNTSINQADATGTVTFAFSEAPVAFTLADTSAVGGTLSNLQQTDATHYTATFTGASNTDINNASVSVTAGSYQDLAGNAGAGDQHRQLHCRHHWTSGPELHGIRSVADERECRSLRFDVLRAGHGRQMPAFFSLVTTGVTGANIASVDPVAGSNGTQYTVTINTGTGDGTVTLDLTGAAIHDLAGNGLPGGAFQRPGHRGNWNSAFLRCDWRRERGWQARSRGREL